MDALASFEMREKAFGYIGWGLFLKDSSCNMVVTAF
jgi:hypothetical protein